MPEKILITIEVGPELKNFLADYLEWGRTKCGMPASIQAFCSSIGTVLPRTILGNEQITTEPPEMPR